MSETPIFTISPSDCTFLWSSCQRCFWLKVRAKFKRPAGAFPRVFGAIDTAMKDFYAAKRTDEIDPSLPPGQISFSGRRVQSKGLALDGHIGMLRIVGNIDTAASFDEGGHGVVDFKTALPSEKHVPFYWRQLSCYALALENPGRGSLRLDPILRMGLLCVEPIGMTGKGKELALECDATYLDVPRDDDAFEVFLDQVLSVLEKENPPDPAPDCDYCRYLKVGSLVLLTEIYEGGE